MDTKKCSMCKEDKPLEAFGRNKKGEKVIVRSACKACTNAKKKAQRDANPQKVKDILRRSYLKHRKKRLEYARRKRAEALRSNTQEQLVKVVIPSE